MRTAHGFYKCRKPKKSPKKRGITFDRKIWYETRGRALILENNKKWQAKNPDRVRANRKRHAAMRRGAMRGFWVTEKDMLRLWHRQGRACYWCREPLDYALAQQDHVIPVSRGGIHSIGNIVLACGGCNIRKSARLPIEWRHTS